MAPIGRSNEKMNRTIILIPSNPGKSKYSSFNILETFKDRLYMKKSFIGSCKSNKSSGKNGAEINIQSGFQPI